MRMSFEPVYFFTVDLSRVNLFHSKALQKYYEQRTNHSSQFEH